jgi:hypothetical protein
VADAGTAAVVLPSPFEQELEHDQMTILCLHESGVESFPETLSKTLVQFAGPGARP